MKEWLSDPVAVALAALHPQCRRGHEPHRLIAPLLEVQIIQIHCAPTMRPRRYTDHPGMQFGHGAAQHQVFQLTKEQEVREVIHSKMCLEAILRCAWRAASKTCKHTVLCMTQWYESLV